MIKLQVKIARFIVCLTFLVSALATAQETRASLGGRVTDPQGAAVPGARVVVVSESTNVKTTAVTNGEGNWLTQFLNPGRYRLSVAVQGFKTVERTGIELQVADAKFLDMQLDVGSVSQVLDVKASVPLIDTTSATSGSVVTETQLNEIPSMTHIPTLLATLSPGVLAQDQNNNVGHLWSYNAASQFTADGGRNNVYSNNFQLDGMPDTKSGGSVSFIPPMDSVQEFRVQTNAYDASIGRQAGSTVIMETKSGGNRYHGNLYEFNQNNILNANLFQTNLIGGAVAPVHFNEFGGTLGGPVWIPKVYDGKSKTFFFVSYDETHNVNPLGSGTISVPTALERTGDFSQSFTTQAGVRYPIQVYDPATVNTTTGNRQLFSGNVIPANRLSGIAQKILAFLPLPNVPGDPTGNAVNNYVPPSVRLDTYRALSIRGDQNWNERHRSFMIVRWGHLVEHTGDTFGLTNIAAGNFTERKPENLGLDHVWIVSPNKVLDMRFAVNRYEEPGYDAGAGYDVTKLGFSSSYASLLSKSAFPYITGFAGNFGSGNAGSFTNTTYYTWSAALTHTKGNHTLHYGGEYWNQQQAGAGLGAQAQFDFNSNWTRQNNNNSGGPGVGSTFASFLLGLPSGGSLPVNAQSFYSQRYAAVFIQDDWKLTRRLTLNMGLRWDVERPPVERYNRLTDRFDPNVVNPISAVAQAAYASILSNPANASNPGVSLLQQLVPASAFVTKGAVQFAGVNGVPRTPIDTDWHEFQPRFGVAYQIRPTLVIRGGVGRFTQASFITGGQFGFSRTTSLIATTDNYLTPYDTLATPFRNGVLAPVGSSLGALTNLGSGPNWDDPALGRIHSWEYSLHVQKQLGSWLVEVGYSHNKSYGISWGWNQNQPSFENWRKYNGPQFDSTGRPLDTLLWNQQVPNPYRGLPGVNPSISLFSAQTIALNQLLNPIPLYGGVTENKPTGKNQFDAGLFKLERRFSKGVSLIASFTWSKLFEDTAFVGGDQLRSQGAIEHKLGGEDRPYHFSIAPVVELPFGKGKKFGSKAPKLAELLVGGWILSGNYNVQSGVPVVFGSNNFFFSGKDFSLGDKKTLAQWFDTSQFVPFPSKNTSLATINAYPAWVNIQSYPGYNWVPPASDSARNGVYQDFNSYIRTFPTRWNDVRADGVNELNLGLHKSFPITERIRLQLRFDAFNAFNRPRFGAPTTDPTSSSFGRVQGSQQNQARSIELAGKLYF